MKRAFGFGLVALLTGFGVTAITGGGSPLLHGGVRSSGLGSAMIHGWPAVVTGLAFLALGTAAFFGMCLPSSMHKSTLRRRGINYSLIAFAWFLLLACAGVLLRGDGRAV